MVEAFFVEAFVSMQLFNIIDRDSLLGRVLNKVQQTGLLKGPPETLEMLDRMPLEKSSNEAASSSSLAARRSGLTQTHMWYSLLKDTYCFLGRMCFLLNPLPSLLIEHCLKPSRQD